MTNETLTPILVFKQAHLISVQSKTKIPLVVAKLSLVKN